MRHFKNFMILVMTLTAVTFTSCSSDDDSGDGDDPGNPSAGSGTLVAKVDGNNYESTAIASSATIANNGQNLIIIAANSSGKAISIQVLSIFDGPGTYTIGGGANISVAASYTETDVSNPQNPTSEAWQAPFDDTVAGEVIVTEVTDTKVKGTFNFSCKNTGGDQSVKIITDGSFNLDKEVVN